MSAIGGKADSIRVGLEGPLLAEAVEELRTINFSATFIRAGNGRGNFDSRKSRFLNHYFKHFLAPEFFNGLSHKRTLANQQPSFAQSLNCNRTHIDSELFTPASPLLATLRQIFRSGLAQNGQSEQNPQCGNPGSARAGALPPPAPLAAAYRR